MRDIEQTGLRPRMEMFREDPRRILHRHFIAGERDEFCPQTRVQGVKWRSGRSRVIVHGVRSVLESRLPTNQFVVMRPLCPMDLKDWLQEPFAGLWQLTSSVRSALVRGPAFQSSLPLAVLGT